MIIYKEYWDEKSQEVKFKEIEVADKNDPATIESNCTEFINAYYTDKASAENGVARFNKDIKAEKFFIKKCKECGIFFVISADEKQWYEDRGMQLPKRCEKCRKKRKVDKTNGR